LLLVLDNSTLLLGLVTANLALQVKTVTLLMELTLPITTRARKLLLTVSLVTTVQLMISAV
jgi:hypothetical protein